MPGLIAFALLLAVLLLGVRVLGDRAHTIVRLEHGHASIQRGALPPGLLSELKDVARHQHQARGQLEIRGQGETLLLRTPGLDEGTAQRVRNVVLLRRQQIHRP